MLSVIIPASNEEPYIAACLNALFQSDAKGVQVVVVANGCKDRTAAVAKDLIETALPSGWTGLVIDLVKGSKPGALNAGDGAAQHPNRVYLDADVLVSRPLLSRIETALTTERPIYVSGHPNIPKAQSWFTRQYTRFWLKVPFNQTPATGYGLFATNAAGRKRWEAFPDLISDDTFVRLQFSPSERVEVDATYEWPMIEGFDALVRVRRRQNKGVAQLVELHPGILNNEGKPPLPLGNLLSMAVSDPVGFVCYLAVTLAVRLKRSGTEFTRGR